MLVKLGEMMHQGFALLGGANSDRWNGRLISSLVAAIPGSHAPDQRNHIAQAVITAQMALKLTDPVEAMLSAQIIAANAAGLDLYRHAWIPEQSIEARTKYLALADKAARTLALLTKALDRHRGRGAAADHSQARHRQRRSGRRCRPGRDRRSRSRRGWKQKTKSTPCTGPCITRPGVRLARSGRGSRAALRRLGIGACAGCMGPAGARRRASAAAVLRGGANTYTQIALLLDLLYGWFKVFRAKVERVASDKEYLGHYT